MRQTTDRLFDSVRDIWESYHSHPFVSGIGDGSLSLEQFRFYMLQDYLYLFDYARVFSLGVVKAKDPALMRTFSENVDQILNGEMNIHKDYMARLGITEEEVASVQLSLDNAAYTSYMLSIGFREGAAEIVAAILSCSWSYYEIAKRLAAKPGALDHPFFGRWIEGYTSAEYEQANVRLIALMNRLSEGYSEEQLQNLEDIFVNCSRHEARFWEMSYRMEL